MGYTIYYSQEKALTKELAMKCVEFVKQLIKDNPNEIAIQFPKSVSDLDINFNGVGGEENQHETFTLYFSKDKKFGYAVFSRGERKDTFNFCKTARKRYDKFVKLALIEIQKITDNAFYVRCDDGKHYYKDTNIEDLPKSYDWNSD